MSDKDNSFRVHVRFNRVEDAALLEDLEHYNGVDRTGRIRYLMRLGLMAAKQVSSISAMDSVMPLVVPQEAHFKQDSADALLNMGLDIRSFQFGGNPS
jgi:hypothetical protein